MEKDQKNRAEIEKLAIQSGVDLFGVADVSKIRKEFYLDSDLREKFSFGISLGKGLIRSIIENIKDHPTELYFHHYRQINFFLDRVALVVSSFIQKSGYQALPIPASQIVDWEKQRAHLSHKKIGYLAGLGWIGRNNLLISPSLGAQFRLVTVLTDMPMEPDRLMEADCEDCVRCLSCCPVGAIKLDRKDFDHWACFEKLKVFRRSGIVGQYICGICVKACPPRQPQVLEDR